MMQFEKRLYPRLGIHLAQEIGQKLSSGSADEVNSMHALDHPYAVYAETGAERISSNELEKIREGVLTIAKGCGFPNQSSIKQRAEFDASCSRFLYSSMPINPGEAARDEVWSFITLVLLPDVARWRFPNSGSERFAGGTRNTFQRMWWRAHAFYDEANSEDPYHLLRKLSEDNMVQIIERPGVSSDRRLARIIADEATRATSGLPSAESIIRNALIMVRQSIPVLSFDVLDEPVVRGFIRNVFEKSCGQPDLASAS